MIFGAADDTRTRFVHAWYLRRFVAYWWFQPWSLSLGIHVAPRLPNLELHLPFGFVRIGWEGVYCGYGRTLALGLNPDEDYEGFGVIRHEYGLRPLELGQNEGYGPTAMDVRTTTNLRRRPAAGR